jgi:hypothetical protein
MIATAEQPQHRLLTILRWDGSYLDDWCPCASAHAEYARPDMTLRWKQA